MVNDILFVNDGTFLIGRSALVTRLGEECVIQSHLRKIRVLKPDVITPYYLFLSAEYPDSPASDCCSDLCSGNFIHIRESNP